MYIFVCINYKEILDYSWINFILERKVLKAYMIICFITWDIKKLLSFKVLNVTWPYTIIYILLAHN